MTIALTRWETSTSPAISIEPTEHQSIAIYWGAIIPAIPDLVSLEQARSGMSYETAFNTVLQAQQRWVQQLHGDSRFTLSLRLVSSGNPEQDLRLGLVGRTEGQQETETIHAARNFFNKIRDTFPNGYPLQSCETEAELALLRLPFLPSPVGTLAEFRRRITPLQTISSADLPDAVGVSIHPWTASPGNFQDLFRAMLGHTTPVAIAINLRATHLTTSESAYLGSITDAYSRLSSLSRSSGTENPVHSSSTSYQEKRLEAEQAAHAWGQLQLNWRSPFEMTVSIMVKSALPQSVTAALQSAIDGQSHPTQARGQGEVVLAQSEPQKMAVRQNWADLTLHRWANTYDLDRLPWLFSPDEVHSLFRLPIANRSGVWGLPSAVGARDARRLESGEAIVDLRLGGLTLSKKQLTQHLLICGVPGSGKTNTSLYLLETLWREHQIPWMVLEPAKTEYRGLQSVNSLKADLMIFSLGDERVAPFRFNPFELPPTLNLEGHLGALVDLFSVSMSMWGPLPNVVEQLIQEAYKRKGYTILGDNTGLFPPKFSDLVTLIPEIVPKLGYKKETTDEITAALSVRLHKFCRGALGQMLNTSHSIPFDELMQRPVILEMSQMTNSDDRAFVMGLILNRCYQYWIARRHEATGDLKHLLLIEEAHNLLAHVSESSHSDQANPKGKAVKNFANMLAEVRGFGQGIAIAEQNPDGLIPDIMVNTNIKFAHRVVEAKNREALGRSMLLTPQQETGLAALKTGQMLYYIGGQSEPSLTTAPNFKDTDNGFNPRLTDAEIQTRFQHQIQAQYPKLYSLLEGCPVGDRFAACLEQGTDLVQTLLAHPRYKGIHPTIRLDLLAVPFGATTGDRVRSILGQILLERGVTHLSMEQIQGILDSALSLLALEAVQEKGKVHGWLGEQVQQAHAILVRSLSTPSSTLQSEWIELSQIPEKLIKFGIPHDKYAECEAPGAFRYENRAWLAGDRTSFKTDLLNSEISPATALKQWAMSQPVFPVLNHALQASLLNCLAIQMTEQSPSDLQYFWHH